MRALARMIDRFCYKRPRFGIPGLIRYVVFGTAIVWVMGMVDTTHVLYRVLVFSPVDILNGQVWRILSFAFVPMGLHPIWLAIGLYVSFMLGTSLEQTWGTAKFTIYFFLSIIVLAAVGMIIYLLPLPFAPAAGLFVTSSYLHLYLFLVFATLYPDAPFRLMFVIPIRAKWLGIVSVVFLIYEAGRTWFFFPVNFIPFSLFFVYFLFTWDSWRHYFGLRSRQSSSTVVNFNRASKQVEKQRQQRAYTRKCEVCGKTDTDYPGLEFRYCSRCNGYHCFCMEHINHHDHFK